ncbi:hypothetical protein [Parafrankia soli]|uniref:hypothetical protein n=1 Tax=Parafrankia soli TaxID=2599596 RepID=UPI001F51F2FC|nr:hypothetical protein [Parafrankia soli]
MVSGRRAAGMRGKPWVLRVLLLAFTALFCGVIGAVPPAGGAAVPASALDTVAPAVTSSSEAPAVSPSEQPAPPPPPAPAPAPAPSAEPVPPPAGTGAAPPAGATEPNSGDQDAPAGTTAPGGAGSGGDSPTTAPGTPTTSPSCAAGGAAPRRRGCPPATPGETADPGETPTPGGTAGPTSSPSCGAGRGTGSTAATGGNCGGTVVCPSLGRPFDALPLPGCPPGDHPTGGPSDGGGDSGNGGGGGTSGGSGGSSGSGGAPVVRCDDGSWARTAGDCPIRRVQCPNTPVSVAVGEPCPKPASARPVPVACWDGSTAPSTAACPPDRTFCPGGVTVPLGSRCAEPAESAKCPPGTARVLGACTPIARPGSPPPPPGVPVAREPEPGELRFDRYVLAAGDLLYAQGAGCTPGAETTLTAGGELVGRTVADQDGRFETVVRFASFRPGHRQVAADCGAHLASGVDMMLVSADTSASVPSVALPFLLAFGSLAVHRQTAPCAAVAPGGGSRSG